jgi:hypothetical protein
MVDAELNYAIYDKEMLAIFYSFQHFRVELTSARNQVLVFTDHKALEYFMTTKDLNARQARWAEFFAKFYFMIAYRPGKTNTIADTLSRRSQDLTLQEARKRALRQQPLLTDGQIDPKIRQEMAKSLEKSCCTIALLDHHVTYSMPEEHKHKHESDMEKDELSLLPVEFNDNDDVLKEELPEYLDGAPPDPGSMVAYDIENFGIIDEVLQANRTSEGLGPLRERARNNDVTYKLMDGLLFYQGRLEVLLEPPELYTKLIRHIYA